MSQILVDQVDKHRKEIKHEVLTYALSELLAMFKASPQELQIQPDWQRLFRWSREQQSSFVESLILEIPIPPLFFFESSNGQWELLDGLQRLSTIIKFMGNNEDVPKDYQGQDNNDDEWHDTYQNDITKPLQLLGAEYLSALDGLSFARLPTSLKLNLKRARLQIYVLKRETDPLYKYEVFKRLNRGGTALEEQELRNCAVRIIGNKFPDFLRKVSAVESFVSAVNQSNELVRGAYLEELSLRFFTMKNYGKHFKHDVSELLTKYMEAVASGNTSFDYEEEEQVFVRTWNVLQDAFEDGTAFTARRRDGRLAGPFSPTIFEIMSLAVAWHLEDAERCTPAALNESLLLLIEQAKQKELMGAGSNSRRKTLGRFELARTWKPASTKGKR